MKKKIVLIVLMISKRNGDADMRLKDNFERK